MRKSIGGNSGYIGYSESVRSAEAKRNGKFPKTLFKKEYGLTEKKFQELLKRGIIYVSEWHHTSKFGNKTEFYDIDNKILFDLLKGDKKAALEAYKKTRNYEKPVKKQVKKEVNYSSSKAFKKESKETEYLLSLNHKYEITKRKNYRFYLNNDFLKYKKYREIFSLNYKSDSIV